MPLRRQIPEGDQASPTKRIDPSCPSLRQGAKTKLVARLKNKGNGTDGRCRSAPSFTVIVSITYDHRNGLARSKTLQHPSSMVAHGFVCELRTISKYCGTRGASDQGNSISQPEHQTAVVEGGLNPLPPSVHVTYFRPHLASSSRLLLPTAYRFVTLGERASPSHVW